MKVIPFAAVLFAFWIAIVFVPATRAQGLTPPQADQLNDEGLKAMLTGLGFEPKSLSKGFLIVDKFETWTLNVQTVLSPDGRKLGLNANLGQVDSPETVAAADWQNLLVENGNIDPSSFYFDKVQKKLYLHRSFDNRAVTPAALKTEIDHFTKDIRSTAQLWKFTK